MLKMFELEKLRVEKSLNWKSCMFKKVWIGKVACQKKFEQEKLHVKKFELEKLHVKKSLNWKSCMLKKFELEKLKVKKSLNWKSCMLKKFVC